MPISVLTSRLWLTRLWLMVIFTAMAWPCATLSTDDYYALTTGYPLLDFASGEPSVTISCLADIPAALGYLYTHWSGRLLLHLLVQLYLRVLGYGALALTVGALTAAAVELTARLASGTRTALPARMVLATLVFLAVIPLYGLNGVWMGNASFSLNYALPATTSLWVLWVLLCRSGSVDGWSRGAYALALVGFGVTGALQEGFAIAIAVPIAIWTAARWRSLSARVRWLVTIYIIGAAVLCSAPGNLHRAAVTALPAAGWCKAVALDLYTVIETLLPPLLLIALILGVLAFRRKALDGWWCCYWVLAVAAVTNLLFCLVWVRFLGYGRPLMPMGLMTVVLAVSLLVRLRPGGVWRRAAAAIIVAAITALAAYWCVTGLRREQMRRDIITAWLASADGTVRLPSRPFSGSMCPYAEWGPEPPNPWNPDFFNRSDPYKFSHYHGLANRSCTFIPADIPPTAEQAVAVTAEQPVSVTAPAGAWYVIVDGVEALCAATATGYTSRRLIPRLKAALGLPTVYYPRPLQAAMLAGPDSLRRRMIIYLPSDIRVTAITLSADEGEAEVLDHGAHGLR